MSKNSGGTSKAATAVYIIIVILALAAVVALILFAARYTNNFTDEFKTFYVSQSGKVLATTETIEAWEGTQRFDVGYTFDFINSSDQTSQRGFSVTAQFKPTDEEDFEFMCGGEPYVLSPGTDLTEALEIEVNKGYFTLEMPGCFREVLERLYPGQAIEFYEDDEEILLSSTPVILITVQSYNAKAEVNITVSMPLMPRPSGIDISGGDIVF